jgi:5-formyltetrahydrofolate cyclo-ligase
VTIPLHPGDAKAGLRETFLARRRTRPTADRASAAAAVTAALLRGLAGARTFAAFVPDETEPGHGRLARGRFGLLEPVGPRLGPTAIGAADVVVVPALAVDRSGVRLGRGGGYYDRALRYVRPGATLVAAVFDDELFDALPAEPHDHLVTAVVTPSGGWQALGPAAGAAH